MTPEDRVSYTMELQEDVAAKVEIIKKAIATESELLPQGKSFQLLHSQKEILFWNALLSLNGVTYQIQMGNIGLII